VDLDEAREYARRNGFVTLIETSAKDGTNIEEALNTLVKSIAEHPGAFKAHDDAQRAKDDDQARVDVAARAGEEPTDTGCCWSNLSWAQAGELSGSLVLF